MLSLFLGMAIMHTSIPPKFLLNRNETDLLYPASVTHNSPNKNGSSIDVKFVNVVNLTDQPILTLRFNFETANGYWSLNYVVVDGSKGSLGILNLTGNPIIVPQNFSYKCSQTVIFADNATHPTLKLTLKDIQVFLRKNFIFDLIDWFQCIQSWRFNRHAMRRKCSMMLTIVWVLRQRPYGRE